MSLDIYACTRLEPTPDLVRELVAACGDGLRVRPSADESWPEVVYGDGGMLCSLQPPEVLAGTEDVDDLAAGAAVPHQDLPLWLVTVRPADLIREPDFATVTALAEGLVARCGGWAYADGKLIAEGPAVVDATTPDWPVETLVAVTGERPAADLLAKVCERHVAVSVPIKVTGTEELAGFVADDEAATLHPPVWVTELTPEATVGTPLTLAVAAAEFVMSADAEVFDRDGHRLPLPAAGLLE